MSQVLGQLTPEESFTREYQPTRFDAIGAALTQENLIGVGINMATDFAVGSWYDEDPDFDIAQNEDLFVGVGSEYWDELQGAKSREHLRILSHRYRKLTMDTDYLDQLGAEGTMYRVGSLLGDVPLISVLQKTKGVGTIADALMTARSTYVGRALLAGTIEGSFEGFKQVASPAERTELDMLLAVVGGGLLGGLYNPMKYDPQTQKVMQETLADAISAKGTGKAEVAGERIRKVIEDKQFNVSSVFHSSPSQTMREIGKKILNDPLQQQLDDFTAIEVRDNVKMAMDNAFSMNFDHLYLEYMEKMYGKQFAMINRLNASKQDEFYNMMGDRFYNRANALMDDVPEEFLQKMDGAFTKMSNDSYDILYRNKHTKFVDGSIDKADDYMPLSWTRDKIKASTSSGLFKRADFEKAVRNGLEKRMAELGIEADATRLKEAAKRFTSRMYEEDIAVGGQGYIMKDNAMKRSVDELADILDMSDDEVKALTNMLRERSSGASKGTAAATKMRTPLDLEGSYTTADGVTINLKDFVDTNVQSMWHRYSHSMSGDTALRTQGINSRAELQQLRDKIVKELSNESGGISAANQKYLTNFDNMVAHLLGMSTKSDPMGTAWKATRMMNNLTRSAKMGMTWFAMAAEVARVNHRLGMKSMIKSIPALRDVLRAYKGKGTSPVYRELQLWEALGGELNQMVSIAKYEDMLRQVEVDGAARLMDRAERFSDIANEATMLVGGVKTGTAMLEYMHSIGARAKMMDMAKKGMDKKAYEFFEHYGFSREMADRIAEQMRKFSDGDPNAPLLNLDKWEDNLGHIWSLGVRRQSYELIQRSNFGDHVGLTVDGKLVNDTVMGSLAMSLKNYMIVAYNKQLSKGLTDMSRGGKDAMDVFGNWTTQAVFSAISYTAKQVMIHGNDQERLEEALQLDRIIANSFSMTTFSSFIPNVVDFGAQAVADDAIFNTFAKGQVGGFMPAPVQYAGDAITGLKGLTNLASPWGDASEYELRKALGSLPLSNAIGVKLLTSELAEAFAEDNKLEW